MISDIYKIEGKYPDPQEIEKRLKELSTDPNSEFQYKDALAEISESGLDSHPLLERFFVES
jgi:hypothetical protein